MFRLRRVPFVALALWGLAACSSSSEAPLTGNRISSVRFSATRLVPCAPCDMVVTADDTTEFRIKETTGSALIGPDSTWMVYSTFGGAGGYRNSGQALWRYNIRTGDNLEVMREYYLIDQLALLKVPGGAPFILVSMREPLTLVRHLAIVDPDRGEVFRSERTVVLQSDIEGLTLAEWGPPVSWLEKALNDSTGLPKAPPLRTWRLTLAQFRTLAVLTNVERIWGAPLQFAPAVDLDSLQDVMEEQQERAPPPPVRPP